ncbi:MAG: GNAT family N-acetyltransferase [Alteraurantiacibacter sp.]
MTTISYHHTVNDLQGLDWSGAGPFARLGWFAQLEESGHRPLVACARNRSTAVALPLRKAKAGLESLTNWYAFTWSELRTHGISDNSLLEALAEDLATHTHRITFTKLSAEDDTVDRLSQAFHHAGWLVMVEACDTNHILHVAGRSFRQFLADRPGQLRTTLKRKATKVQVSISTQFDPGDWTAYEEIYADSWKPEEGDSAMLRKFAMAESDAGRFRFAMALHNGAPVAAQFWTVDGDTAYIHKLAHRTSSRKLSPGTTLTAALFERVIDTDGVKHVDFGTGDDPYKRDWMEQTRVRWQLTCLRPASPLNWPHIARAELRKLVSRSNGG